MAYEKNTWARGDVVTSAKLNHMEDGIASGGVMVVNSTRDNSTDTVTLDKTWQEIRDASILGGCVVHSAGGGITTSESYYAVNTVYTEQNLEGNTTYYVKYNVDAAIASLATTTPDGYPSNVSA